jgi:UDP-N-acetylmuramoyl-tripeptide--D-alanyl-D-alanine ligase
MRLEIEEIPGRAGCFLLNDAYNANPASVLRAMETANLLNDSGRVFGVLGDMKELGATEEEAHREIGRLAGKGGLDFFAGVGALMTMAVAEARRSGMDEECVAAFDTPEEAAAWTQEHLKAGDWVLVKGSRSMQMERAVEVIRN